MIRLWFDKGTILLRGEVGTPYGKWDPRVDCYRIKALHYRDVLSYLKESKLVFQDDVPNLPPIQQLSPTVELRRYQQEALEKWREANMRGVLVLPTAAGKTYVALKAISQLKTQTLVIVPTLDLIDQWQKRIIDHLGMEAGAVGGGQNTVKMITVSTYDSAYIQAENLGNRFMFIVFDEVHHLASPSYMQIAEMYIALTTEEQKDYETEIEVFRSYLKEKRIVLRSPEDFQKFIMSTGRDRRAREALLSRNRAVKIALNSEAKLCLLAEQLETYKNKKTLIFTLHNDLVYTISRRFLIPAITYQTPKEERKEILESFRKSEYRAIVTSQVLDEGVDVPDASAGYILSGTGSTREYIQRLGRILRKVEGKNARLVEIVSNETVEVGISRRRRHKKPEEG